MGKRGRGKTLKRKMRMKTNNNRKRGFSLIEMMLVLAVVGLLMAFAAPNLFSLITANTLTSEGTLLRNQLTLGQQKAVSKSADVEVRFFKLANLSAARTEPTFSAFQLFQYSEYGRLIPVSAFFRIRTPVAINEGLSTLLQPGIGSTKEDKKFGYDSPRAGVYDAPTGKGGAPSPTPYVSFRFRPDGGTDLPAKAGGDTWYLTLVQGEGAADSMEPSNYVCLQVNPHNGQIEEFRP